MNSTDVYWCAYQLITQVVCQLLEPSKNIFSITLFRHPVGGGGRGWGSWSSLSQTCEEITFRCVCACEDVRVTLLMSCIHNLQCMVAQVGMKLVKWDGGKIQVEENSCSLPPMYIPPAATFKIISCQYHALSIYYLPNMYLILGEVWEILYLPGGGLGNVPPPSTSVGMRL